MRRAGLRGSFWPTDRQHALLRVVLGPAEEARRRWRALQPLDLGALETGSFPLLPLLYERLAQVEPQDERLPLLLGTYRATWYRSQLALERAAALVAALRGHAVEPLLVGGHAALLRWYPRPGSRPLAELELLVDIGDATRADAAARAAGWLPTDAEGALRRYVDGDGRILLVHEGVPPEVAGPLGPARAFATIRADAALEELLAAPIPVPAPADELLFHCGTGARTTLPPTLQWLLDTWTILASPAFPEPEQVVERARLFHLVEPLRDAIAYLSSVADTPVLAAYRLRLAREPKRRRDVLAYRLGGMRPSGPALAGLALTPYLRAGSELSLARLLWRLPRHLQERWKTGRLVDVPVVALRKTLRALRQADRNRSALSRGS